MGRKRPAVFVGVLFSVFVLIAGGARVLFSDPRTASGSHFSHTADARRPVQVRVTQLAPRTDVQPVDAVVVPTHLREPRASYDLSLLPRDYSHFRSAEPLGQVSRRPRGVGAPAPVTDRARFADPAAATAPPADTGRQAAPAKALSGQVVETFDTTDINHNQINTGGFLTVPPDTNGAAGPNHLVSVTNVTIRFHGKDGSLLHDGSLRDFFGAFSPPTLTFDPRVVFDHVAQRFVVITDEFTDVQVGAPSDTASVYVAVSDDADPTGTWYQAELNVLLTFMNDQLGFVTHHWLDFPGLAVDEEAIYISGKSVSNFTTGGFTGGYRLFVLDKGLGTGGLYDGGALSSAVYDPFAGGAGLAITSQPAQIFGSPGRGVGTYLVGYSGLNDGTNEFLQVIQVDDPLGALTFTPQFVALGDIEDSDGALPDASQLGTTVRIDTNARRPQNAVWRNDTLWTATHVAGRAGSPDADQVSAHWYKLNTLSSGVVNLADQGDISGNDIAPGTFTFFPSVAVNDRDEAVIGFSASGPQIYPSAYAAVRLPADPAGTTGPSLLIHEGVTFYIRTLGGSNRWGDYSSVAVDPADQCFWVHNQYAKLQGTFINNEGGRWATAFGRLCAFDCGNGTLETPEVCDDGNTIDGDACSNVCEVNECGLVDTDRDTLGDGCDPDDDNDGVFDPDDCAPLDAQAAVDPVEVTDLLFDSPSPGQIIWTSQTGVVYDVAGGLLSELRAQMGTASATCLIDDSALPHTVDARPDPLEGDGYYYIVRSKNACGSSGYGAATGGAARQPAAACP